MCRAALSCSRSLENPFRVMDEAVAKMREETPVIFVDVHAETTSEKIAIGRFLDGRVSAVVGTHTHTQTADERVFPGGTAFLCDAGMCGPTESVLGREIEPIVDRFITNLPMNFPVAKGPVQLSGALIEIDESTGRAVGIERVAEIWQPPVSAPPAGSGTGWPESRFREQMPGDFHGRNPKPELQAARDFYPNKFF